MTMLAERASAALDAAFADEIKRRFAWLVGQEAGDGGGRKGDIDAFRTGMLELKSAYAAAKTMLQDMFQ